MMHLIALCDWQLGAASPVLLEAGPALQVVLGWAQPVVVGLFALTQMLLLVYAAHRYQTLWRWARRRPRPEPPAADAPGTPPFVTVQLPLYNERLVAGRLIDAVAAMDYPASRFQIQVLDDSTDETLDVALRAADRHRARGIEIEVLHRDRREGYKAGALAAGLARARGGIIVVFDADFVPTPDFLRLVVPHFADPSVGMVQARWGHLNRDRSLLTLAQAAMLDAHFLLEHEARMSSGLFFNFNGTAGAWRRECIESAGGWTHDTLTEDLDLSYRAQLSGWRFVFVPQLVAPAELPAGIEALKSQQRRWAKGSIQTARKLLPDVWRSALPLRVKVEAFFHLTCNIAYPLLLLSGLLLLPVLQATAGARPVLSPWLDIGVILTGMVPVCAFLAWGQWARGARGWRVARDLAAVLVVGAGLSLNNARAVMEGLGTRVGGWDRTPKTGDGGSRAALRPYTPGRCRSGWIELLLGLGLVGLAALAGREGHPRSVPFLLLLGGGLACVGALSARRKPGASSPQRHGAGGDVGAQAALASGPASSFSPSPAALTAARTRAVSSRSSRSPSIVASACFRRN